MKSRGMWLALVLALAVMGTVQAANPPYQSRLGNSAQVYQRVYAPGLWKQTFDSHFPTSVQYTPVSTTAGPNIASTSFSASTSQAVHFTMFMAHNTVPANMDVYVGQSCDASHTAAQKVVWHLQIWRVSPNAVMSSIIATNAQVDTTFAVTPSATARVYEVMTLEQGIPYAGLRGFDALNSMFLVRLARETADSRDNCTSAISLHWFGIKGYTLTNRPGIGF